ncbi:MAG: exodeoxyribonuclease VII small subunit [Desulfovibrionaceae bacterium]|nr:exodeoxyribonuclease VII small subunit [Desulfovibrionaceae bacterium]
MTRKTRELSFEERLTRLQAIVSALESGESPLEESVALYKEGLAHAKACRGQLAKARHEIEIYQNGACQPFEPESWAEAGGDESREGGPDGADGNGYGL